MSPPKAWCGLLLTCNGGGIQLSGGVPKNPHLLRVNGGHVPRELAGDPLPNTHTHQYSKKPKVLTPVTKKLCMGLFLSPCLTP